MDCKGVHVLFCDHDPDSGSKTLELLRKCSYKVTTVKSARQVLDTVESENSDIDIVLSDMEMPKDTGFKMLKRIMRKDDLNHIAVVVMSERDEMPIVAKCLQLGAVDYLVKPLRLNEVMNLWTHMWRKRKMLGLPDKCAIIEFVKQPAECLESVTTSDVIPEKDKENRPLERSTLNAQSKAEVPPKLELSLKLSSSFNLENHSHEGSVIRPPSNDSFRRASAFSVYQRPNIRQSTEQSTNICSVGSPSLKSGNSLNGEMHIDLRDSLNGEMHIDLRDTLGVKSTHPICDSFYESARDSSMADENKPCDMESHMSSGSPNGVIPSCSQRTSSGEQNNPSDGYPCQDACTSNVEKDAFGSLPVANTSQPTSHTPRTYCCDSGNKVNVQETNSNVYAYYPVGQMVMPQFMGYSGWPTMVIGSPVVGGKQMQSERREAALHKFRMKRKGRCFEKRIRYVSRKKLAEQRPRVRGQFVKRSAVTNMVENMVIETEYADEEGEADDEQGCSELDNHSSPDCLDEG